VTIRVAVPAELRAQQPLRRVKRRHHPAGDCIPHARSLVPGRCENAPAIRAEPRASASPQMGQASPASCGDGIPLARSFVGRRKDPVPSALNWALNQRSFKFGERRRRRSCSDLPTRGGAVARRSDNVFPVSGLKCALVTRSWPASVASACPWTRPTRERCPKRCSQCSRRSD